MVIIDLIVTSQYAMSPASSEMRISVAPLRCVSSARHARVLVQTFLGSSPLLYVLAIHLQHAVADKPAAFSGKRRTKHV